MNLGNICNMGFRSKEDIDKIKCEKTCIEEPRCPFVTFAHLAYCDWPQNGKKVLLNIQFNVCGINCPSLIKAYRPVELNKDCQKLLDFLKTLF